jgi:1-acyl-sn-glycerol-3-phosphate acyltransferase
MINDQTLIANVQRQSSIGNQQSTHQPMSDTAINRPPRHTTPRIHRIFKTFALIIIKLVARIDLRGMEHVPLGGAFVVVTNHLSSFDTLSIIGLAPVRQATAFGAIEHRSDFIAGWALDKLGLIWVRRGEVDREAVKIALDELKAGTVVGVAIEGTRSRTGGLLPGKTGAVYLANRAQAPIVPMTIWGTEQVMRNLKRLRRSTIHIRIGPVIRLPEGRATPPQLEAYTDQIMLTMAHTLPPEYRGVYRDRVKDEG